MGQWQLCDGETAAVSLAVSPSGNAPLLKAHAVSITSDSIISELIDISRFISDSYLLRRRPPEPFLLVAVV